MGEELVKIIKEFEESKNIFILENLKNVSGDILSYKIYYYKYFFSVEIITSKGFRLIYNTFSDKEYFENCQVCSYDWDIHINNIQYKNTINSVVILNSINYIDEEIKIKLLNLPLELDDQRNCIEYVKSEFEYLNNYTGVRGELKRLFGNILKSEITSYSKSIFEITLTTEIGVLLIYRTDGIVDDIYKFRPTNTDWYIHEWAIHLTSYSIEIKDIEISEVLLK